MARTLAFALGLAAVWPLAAAPGCTSSGDCNTLEGSNYEQACAVDTDCVAVNERGACCPNVAINVSAQAQYGANFAKYGASCTNNGRQCQFDCFPYAVCCQAGMCRGGDQCSVPVTGDAATKASSDGATADGCASAIACTGACVIGAHNVSTVVDGCPISLCCVPDDAGVSADATTE